MTNAVRLPYTISNQSLTFFVKGKPYSLTREHERYAEAKQLLLAPGEHDAEHLMALVDVRKALLRDSFGAITFIGQDIVFKGQVLTGLWVERILEFQKAGEPFAPLWNALGSLVQNPTQAAIERLPVFLEKSQLGFLEDGRFVAYKAVRGDYMDIHTGNSFRNMIGDTPHMPRDRVNSDPNACCSTGLHVGTPDYVKDFGLGADGRRGMLIAVWPHDVVSVPYSYDGTKMRICAYEVIDELDEEYAATILGRPVLTPRSQMPAPNDATLDEVDQDEGVDDTVEEEDENQIELLPEEDDEDAVIHQPGTVVEYVEFDAVLYGVVGDADQVRGLDGDLIEPDRINRVLKDHEITAAALVCEGAQIRVENDPVIKDGDYTVVGYSEDDDHNQIDTDSWFWRVELRDVDGGVAVINRAIVAVTVRGERLWPRTVAEQVEFPVEPEAPALEAKVGDRIETVDGGWPPAGIYEVAQVDEGAEFRLIVQTEHDGLQGVLNRYVKRIVRD
ncbi:hypothetical protein ASG32_08265 [Methylobacterium sp. Leaf361]|uniref:hypothetical protein n=1 Tax=Methylobacterium sp. Leaf361 TaxID=1736352 RepID=UPI000700F4AB|nr:hypothetical protein [Methylobacterium sp. Leaf361]KQS75082.1 hypothetical protein ASG32_08265 [Methylobacterium sp. Leaf361]